MTSIIESFIPSIVPPAPCATTFKGSLKDIALFTLDEHREIVSALRERNAQRVEELLVKHNRVSIERLLPRVAEADSSAGATPSRVAAGAHEGTG